LYATEFGTVTTSAICPYGSSRSLSSRLNATIYPSWVGDKIRPMGRTPQPYRNGELVIVIDCSDLDRSARFWSEVLGFTAGRATGGPYRRLLREDGQGVEVLLQRVRDDKGQKNRMHLDLRTADMAAEVSRILALGATLISEQPVVEDGLRWHVLADPDGNEFCVLEPAGRP
jgi:predicted enzyme related to lactoylglutathione lyase